MRVIRSAHCGQRFGGKGLKHNDSVCALRCTVSLVISPEREFAFGINSSSRGGSFFVEHNVSEEDREVLLEEYLEEAQAAAQYLQCSRHDCRHSLQSLVESGTVRFARGGPVPRTG